MRHGGGANDSGHAGRTAMGRYTEEKKYVETAEITCYDVDSKQMLKPASFMDMAQEIAHKAAGCLGFGYDDLQKSGTAWVLSRMHYRFLRHPKWREQVRLSTWHKGPYGPFYLRDFTMEGLDGERLVECTSSWIILDVVNRRMCRTTEIMEMVPEGSICSDNAIAEPAEKVMMPKGIVSEAAGVHRVEYSDMDFLGHTNNARYVVWAMDCIDFDELTARTVKEVAVSFNHETHAGDEVILEKTRTENADASVIYHIEGKVDGRSAFTMSMTL